MLIANMVCLFDIVYLVLVKLMKQKIEKEIWSDHGDMSKLEKPVYDVFQLINAYERNQKNSLTGEMSRD